MSCIIEIKDSEKEFDEVAKEVVKKNEDKENPTEVLNSKSNKIELYLTKSQYLSHLKDDIINNLAHITLLEAGAGYGKTEMIKSFNEEKEYHEFKLTTILSFSLLVSIKAYIFCYIIS